MSISNHTNSFSGHVQLSRTSSPHSSICSGTEFKNNALTTETISPEKDSTVYPFVDFMEARTNSTLDSELCSVSSVTYELLSCLNRFGGALYREVGKVGTEYERISYDERCVGYKTLDNEFLTHTWQEESVLHYHGLPQATITLINGPCIEGELEQEYTVPADISFCNGNYPCSELKKLVCKLDTNTATTLDPSCLI